MSTNPTITPLKRSTREYDDKEFLGEHFSYLLADLLDDWYNGYNLVAYKAIDAYEDYIKNNRPEIKDMEMHEAIDQFQKRVEQELDVQFNIFQKYMYDNITRLPPNTNIQLAHHKGLDLSATKEQEDLLDQELLKARRKILAQKGFKHKLECKSRDLDKELAEVDKVSNMLQLLTKIARNENVPHVDDSVRYVASEAERLRQSTAALVEAIQGKGLLDRVADNQNDRSKFVQATLQKLMERYKNKAPTSSSS
ncbi:predicted protein [Lichtheimia corymbifera JMRC:FSU:9682]|uniref:Uncharacterized protein n=1 Tax=Lichtheimia corymbifera JMRC:FSU:9682 TaxID=1263082 RepID=A0A068RIJ4_9FUNG|nr:predicted protein [Lichtheimia corymbifera JMRC:FSU:9682]